MKTFNQIREELPETELAEISSNYFLEALNLGGLSPNIVFVHGGGGNLWNPYRQLDHFQGDYGLLTYNLSGYGRSSYSRGYRLADHVDDLRGLVEFYNLKNVVIHGHSYGTEIAVEYAKKFHPRGLVLAGGGIYNLTPWWEKPLLRLLLALRLYKLPMEWLAKPLAKLAFHPETSDKRIKNFLECNPLSRRRSAWETIVKSFWNYEAENVDRIDSSTLVLHGPADGIVPVEAGKRTADEIPNSKFKPIKRTGHVPMVERPEQYNKVLQNFLREVKKR
ncbi:MAG: alpha/beta fold hydrolase [bacterium]